MKALLLFWVVLLIGCESPGPKLSEQIQDVGTKVQNAFYDLGAAHGHLCSLRFIADLQAGKTPIPIRDCIKKEKKAYWKENGLVE